MLHNLFDKELKSGRKKVNATCNSATSIQQYVVFIAFKTLTRYRIVLITLFKRLFTFFFLSQKKLGRSLD